MSSVTEVTSGSLRVLGQGFVTYTAASKPWVARKLGSAESVRLPAAMAPSTTPPTKATSRTRASHARQRRRDSARITRTRAPKLTSRLAVWPIVSRRQRMSAGVSCSCWHPGFALAAGSGATALRPQGASVDR